MPSLVFTPSCQADDLDFTVEVLTVGSGEGGKRLDAFLATRMPEQSRSYFGGLCQLGMVLVGGKNSKKSVQVEEGQEVEVRFVVSPELSLEGENIPLDVSLQMAKNRFSFKRRKIRFERTVSGKARGNTYNRRKGDSTSSAQPLMRPLDLGSDSTCIKPLRVRIANIFTELAPPLKLVFFSDEKKHS